MRPRLAIVFCSLCFLSGVGWQPVWGDTDKTLVDLERGPAAPPARYARLRWTRVYRYDKTDMDFATPITEPPDGSQLPPQQNSTNAPATPPGRRTSSTAPPESGR